MKRSASADLIPFLTSTNIMKSVEAIRAACRYLLAAAVVESVPRRSASF